MARPRSTQQHPKHDAWKSLGWFGSSNESVEGVKDWDIKAQTFAEAVLGVLSSGKAIMFGISYDGQAVSITVFDGDAKSRKWVTDCIELDDAMAHVWHRTHPKELLSEREGKELAAD